MLSVNSAMESGRVAATAFGAKSADPEDSRELDLARLKGLRSTQRGKVTNLLKNLKTLYTTKTSDADSLAYAIHSLEQAVSLLSSTESDLEAMGECTRVDQYFSDSDELIFKSRRLLSRLDKLDDRSSSSGGSSAVPSMHSASLPRLSLPKFTGSFMEWAGFWDQFRAAVHDTGIPDIHKFVYLKSCLEGDAKHSLDEYSVSSENYSRAVDELRGRFGNPSVLIGMYSNALLEIPQAKHGDLVSFRCVVDKFRSYLRELRSFIDEVSLRGAQSEEAGSRLDSGSHTVSDLILSPVLLRKLPPEVVLDWNRKTRSDQQDRFNLEKLLEFVKGELEEREALGVERQRSSKVEPIRKQLHSGYVPRRATVTAAVTSPVKDIQPRPSSPKSDYYRDVQVLPVGSRRDFVSQKRLCFNCLRANHRVSECRSQRRCRQCNRKHHSLLHDEYRSSVPNDVSSGRSSGSGDFDGGGPSTQAHASTASPARRALLQTALIRVANEECLDKFIEARVVLDPGSEETYVSSRLVRALNLSPVDRRTFAVETFGGARSSPIVHRRMALIFASRHVDMKYRVLAWEVEKTCHVFRPAEFSVQDREFFEKFKLADTLDGQDRVEQIDLLLGADSLPGILLPEAPVRSPSGLLLTSTVLGWTLLGSCPSPHSRAHSVAFFVSSCLRVRTVEDLWSLESLGIDPDEESEKLYPAPVYITKEKRYEVSLPWRCDSRPVSNKPAALARLKSVLRLPREKREAYENYLEELEAEHIIEDVPVSEAVSENSFYLPHHGVWRNGKLRVVFDGSAKSPNGISLNDALDPGPNLTQHILSAMLNFRFSPIAMTTDVTHAFLQVGIQESDRNYLRFVWSHKGLRWESRFRRVPFGLSSSPFLLQHVLQHHLTRCEHEYPVAVDSIRRGLYVDDVSIGCSDRSEILPRRNDAIEIFKGAGMHLHKWRLGGCSPPDGVEFSATPGCVLGIRWMPDQDVLEILHQTNPSLFDGT